MRLSLAATLALTLFLISITWAAREVPPSGSNLGSVTGGNFRKAYLILDQKCTSCHGVKVIEEALTAGKDMLQIQHRMERRGVVLNASEKSVLGIFWGSTPFKGK